ncbi:MAG TPA: phage baseplate assembly protein V [Methylotenera sp.]
MTTRLFSRMLAPLNRAISNMALRATVVLVNSASKMQTLQLKLRGDEAKESIEHFEPYGYTSKAHSGAEAVTLFFSGDRSHGVAIVVADRRFRLTALEDGEVALHDDQGQKVHLMRDKVLVETPLDIELRGKNIKIHATDSFVFDVNGHGQQWLPDRINTWQIGEVAGTPHAISPPEIP